MPADPVTEGQAVPKPDQSTPTPEEIRTEPHVQDAQDAIFVLRESLAVASWRDFGATIEPILTRLYHAAKIAGKIEAHEQDARGICSLCGKGFDPPHRAHPEAPHGRERWWHVGYPCKAGPIWDALTELRAQEGRG